MRKLKEQDYDCVKIPLSQLQMNTMFAEAVVAKRLPGLIYVNDEQNPRTFYIVHPYGMSLLFGQEDDEAFNQSLSNYLTDHMQMRQGSEWLQVDPGSTWAERIDAELMRHNREMASDGNLADHLQAMEKQTRVNFRFNRDVYTLARQSQSMIDSKVLPMTKELFAAQKGGVIARYFWQDGEHFKANGAGCCIVHDGEIAAAAFSAYRNERQLEIGIETDEAYRGKGYAFAVCSALIEYCLEQGLEPVWGCRLGNVGSLKLAMKLGFEPTLHLPYYRLAQRKDE
ncbi:GNAT family N-acetyltransferase [Gorillibacterium massiliense]|uniref:GNAT family N-acetyltransferase n=1 Tax=Gorillibacterium massiliense TaxID=1280390 RepID=UPI0004AFF966|nr:GNAT family N-acetyltransferase [Gorillibacterium massiliense]